MVAPKGTASLKLLENALVDEAGDLPDPVRGMGAVYVEQIARLTEVIERLASELEAATKTDVAYADYAQSWVSALSPPVPWRRLHPTSMLSTAGATLLPGSVSCHGNGRPEARPGGDRSAKRARPTFAVF